MLLFIAGMIVGVFIFIFGGMAACVFADDIESFEHVLDRRKNAEERYAKTDQLE